MNSKLPPLPASDEISLNRNKYNNFYEQGSKEFWGQNEITYNEIKPFKKCNHFFRQQIGEAICEICHFGLYGVFDIRDGIIYHMGEPMVFQ